MIERRTLPDFIVVGAQKSGTTSLWHYLSEDPRVYIPPEKEVHFFDKHYSRGLDWYVERFSAAPIGGCNCIGEITPMYLFHPWSVGRIREHLPDCKIIVLLRNPVDRAYSHYQHSKALGHEALPFDEALEAETERIASDYALMQRDPHFFSQAVQRYSYRKRGEYDSQVAHVLDSFSPDQVLVIQSEELFRQPAVCTKTICDYLDLPGPARGSFPRAYGRSYSPMDPQVRRHLEGYFEPYNERLFSLISRRFDW